MENSSAPQPADSVIAPQSMKSSNTRIIVVMGVSGSGKSTVGSCLARRLDWQFVEGDEFHSAENIRKMAAGIALTDADRCPWLDAISRSMAESVAHGDSKVYACSALRRSYRERLRAFGGGSPDIVKFVYLKVPADVLQARLDERKDHYMKSDLLESQLGTLEEPTGDEALIIEAGESIEATADTIIGNLMLHRRETFHQSTER